MSKQYLILGPPGTGKTTRLTTKSIPKAVDLVGADKVLVSSFTKAAARELGQRQDMIPAQNVGTLHALCYRALNCPTIAETKVKEWNEQHPELGLSKGSPDTMMDMGGSPDMNPAASGGDGLLSDYGRLRNRLVDRSLWPQAVKAFAKQWEGWKADQGYFDFTDLLETAHKEYPYPPNQAEILFLDEAQDSTPLQHRLVRSWGEQCKFFVMAGDDDQTLYRFAGATPDSLLKGMTEDNVTVLNQSYRVPKKVHEKAMRIISGVKNRWEKEYLPTSEEGLVQDILASYIDPDPMMAQVMAKAKAGESVMVLASCGYMLNRSINYLRAHGLPFHNPYRTAHRGWNPLYSEENMVSGRDLLLNYLKTGPDEAYWTIEQLVTWASALNVDDALLRGQGKKNLKILKQAVIDRANGLHTSREVLKDIFVPEAIEPILKRDIAWLTGHVPPGRIKGLKYPIKVYKRHGIDGLRQTPKVIPGTIHSVKGGEADHVFLMPDLSMSAYEEMRNSIKGRESMARVFYVAVTRARKSVTICKPGIQRGKMPLYMEV